MAAALISARSAMWRVVVPWYPRCANAARAASRSLRVESPAPGQSSASSGKFRTDRAAPLLVSPPPLLERKTAPRVQACPRLTSTGADPILGERLFNGKRLYITSGRPSRLEPHLCGGGGCMRFRKLGIFTAGVLLADTACGSGSSGGGTSTPIKVGVTGPFTGNYAAPGIDI